MDDTWAVQEETLAGYLQAGFNFDNSVVPVSALLGVRYYDTNTVSSGYSRITVAGVSTFPEVRRDGGYTDWLPSINVRFDFTEKFVGRHDSGRSDGAAESFAARIPATLDGHRRRTGTRGNPDLLPFKAKPI